MPSFLILTLALSLGVVQSEETFLKALPIEFQASPANWSWVSYESPLVAVLPGTFNRSVFNAPHEGEASDAVVSDGSVYDNA